ncbi:uncharacterized protein LOC109540923 isoform X2 [Dendroctonus ponderosae]|uniref:uncharacterized protein LOC109540923 isoform X2 n=1 Tax=Dendroctonus ponderosae TaxID=77166 RepID=UPI00203640E2|nr:uncharacterized protein LOC109540923 isoform X2 [Dendroctonus ponderosae]
MLEMELDNPAIDQSNYYHCSDCDLIMHRNDRKNHLNGSRHKYMVRRRNYEEIKSINKLKCITCNTELSNLHFYTIHLGSKTHKRNSKKREKQQKCFSQNETLVPDCANTALKPIRPMPRKAPVPEITRQLQGNCEVCDYKSVREKYRTRNTKNPEGYNKAYISTVAAYWAINLALDHTVKTFKICINDKEWGDFGDAVVQVELKESGEHPGFITTFGIQFKDLNSNIKSIETLGEGRFSLATFLTQVNTVKSPRDFTHKFIVFTTADMSPNLNRQIKLNSCIFHTSKYGCNYCKAGAESTDMYIFAKSLSNRKKLFINTTEDNDDVLFFFLNDKIHQLPKIYIYSHQNRQPLFGSKIDDLIVESLSINQKFNISRQFIKFIENWSDGRLGGNYKLNKEDVLIKLGHLLLYKFKIAPVVRKGEAPLEAHNYAIWQQATNSVDVTVLKKHPVIVSKVCEPINGKIESQFNLKIDTSTRTIAVDQITIENIKNPVLKMYLFEETLQESLDHIPLNVAYDLFWKSGLVPFLLEVKDLQEQEFVLTTISVLKSQGLSRKYLLMTPVQGIQNSVRHYKSLHFFCNANDLVKKMPLIFFDLTKIYVIDNFGLTLNAIRQSDPFFAKCVSTHEFFDMSLGNYSFKAFPNTLTKVDGHITELVLNDDTIKNLRNKIDAMDEIKVVLLQQPNDNQQLCLRVSDGMCLNITPLFIYKKNSVVPWFC